VDLELLNPYFSRIPWTKSLTDKRVLVIHPFTQSIEAQYRKRELLFKDDLLPAFELKTIKAVQSIAGEKTRFNDWFEALDSMKEKMDSTDYDVALMDFHLRPMPSGRVKKVSISEEACNSCLEFGENAGRTQATTRIMIFPD
jgi:hypothetical protein